MDDLKKFIIGMLNTARKTGMVGQDKAIRVMIQSVYPDRNGIKVPVFVCSGAPEKSFSDNQVWINLDDLSAYRTRDGGATWTKCEGYYDLYRLDTPPDVGDKTFNEGQVTVPVVLSREPELPMEAVPKQYVDQLVEQIVGAGGSNPFYGLPVPTIEALVALDTEQIPDKQVRLVESVGKIYAYDQQSQEAADGTDIVIPASNVGRWIATSPSRVDGGTY